MIGVNKDPASRGGSRYMHETLRAGDALAISAPRNNFALDESAAHSVLIAGGIGITPLMGMIERLRALGKPWRLHYAARTRQQCAFADLLQELRDSEGADLHFSFDKEPGAKMLDIPGIVAALPPGAHIYCCGPLPMLDAFEQARQGLAARARARRILRGAREPPATDGGFTVELARTKRTLEIAPGHTILDSLIEIGIEPPYSCREGICGTCEVAVLEGAPDHRDLVLSAAEKAEGKRMMICCSGSKSRKLVLDL